MDGVIRGDQKVSVHLMITIKLSGAQRLFGHPVCVINDVNALKCNRKQQIFL